jgi:putative membrane protein
VKRSQLLPIVSSALIAAAPGVWAQQTRSDYHGSHMWEGGWMFLYGPLMMVAFVAAVVAVIVLLVRWLGDHRSAGHAPTGNDALDILKERFARGEIDKEEYEERKRILRD